MDAETNIATKTSPELALITNMGALFHSDCMSFLPYIKGNSVDCIFADPPFNLGKDYGNGRSEDQLPEDKYLIWTQQWLSECIRILNPGGSLFLYHMPKWLIPIGNILHSSRDMEFRHWIAIKMKNGFPIKNRLHPAHYGLLYYVKRGKPFKFHVVRTPSPVCRHCGELVRDYGGYRKRYKTQKGDRNIPLIQLADFWDDTVPNTNRKSRPKSMNELPLSIPERAILMSTNKGDIVFDPFVGGGSTLDVAQRHGRYWVGCELGTTSYAVQRVVGDNEAIAESRLPPKLLRVFSDKRFLST